MPNLPLHADTWNALSAAEQQTVKTILTATNLVPAGVNVVADVTAPAPAQLGVGGVFCETACGIAEAAAVAACAVLTGPAATACIAAAHLGGNFCRTRC